MEKQRIDMNEDLSLHSWEDVHPNNVKLDVRMLIPSGHVIQRSCLKTGESRHHHQTQQRYVKYDKDYVIKKLAKVVEPLGGKLSHEHFHELMEEVYFSIQNR